MTRNWPVALSSGEEVECLLVDNMMIKRDSWEADKPGIQFEMTDMANRVFVWQTGSKTCELTGQDAEGCEDCLQKQYCVQQIVKIIQIADLEQGKDDIRYDFLIGENGAIYEGRGWRIVGQHTEGKNAMSIAIALIGDFGKTEPSQAAQDALNSLIFCGKMTQELTSDVLLTTSADMAGQAFYDMLDKCNGLCVGE